MEPQIPLVTEYSLQVGTKFFGNWVTKCDKITNTNKFVVRDLQSDTKYVVRIKCKNINGWSEYSPNSSDIQTAKEGVKSKEDVSDEVVKEVSPLFKDYKKEIINNNMEGVKKLCDKNGKETLKLKDEKNNSLLHISAFIGNVEIFNYLIENGLKKMVNDINNTGGSCLHIAAFRGNLNILDYILDNKIGCNYVLQDFNGMSPLHLCCEKGHYKFVEKLLSILNSNERLLYDTKGRSAYHLVCLNNQINILEMLLKTYNIDPMLKLRNDTEWNLLHMCSLGGSYECAYLLLTEYDCDPKLEGKDGISPYQLSVQNNQTKLIELFEKAIKPPNIPNIPIIIDVNETTCRLKFLKLNEDSEKLVPKILEYEVSYRIRPIGRWVSVIINNNNDSENKEIEVCIKELLPDQKYKIRIRCRNRNDWSDYCSQIEFNTLPINNNNNNNASNDNSTSSFSLNSISSMVGDGLKRSLSNFSGFSGSEIDDKDSSGAILSPHTTTSERNETDSNLSQNEKSSFTSGVSSGTLLGIDLKESTSSNRENISSKLKMKDEKMLNKMKKIFECVDDDNLDEFIKLIKELKKEIDKCNNDEDLMIKEEENDDSNKNNSEDEDISLFNINELVSEDGNNILHYCSLKGNLKFVKFIIEKFKNTIIDITNEFKQTPLHLSIWKSNINVSKYLYEKGANLLAVDKQGRYSIHYASMGKDLNILKWLIEDLKEDIHSMDFQGRTCMHYIAMSGTIEMMEYLKNKGLNLNDKDNNYRTPLHMCCLHCNENICLYLLENKMEVKNELDRGGYSPYDLCKVSRMNDCIYIIDNYINPPKKPEFLPMLINNNDNENGSIKVIIMNENYNNRNSLNLKIMKCEVQYTTKNWGEWITIDNNINMSVKDKEISYILKNLNNNTQYVCRIRFYNKNGWGDYSERSLSFTPLNAPNNTDILCDEVYIWLYYHEMISVYDIFKKNGINCIDDIYELNEDKMKVLNLNECYIDRLKIILSSYT